MSHAQLDYWITDINAVAYNYNKMQMAVITTVMIESDKTTSIYNVSTTVLSKK